MKRTIGIKDIYGKEREITKDSCLKLAKKIFLGIATEANETDEKILSEGLDLIENDRDFEKVKTVTDITYLVEAIYLKIHGLDKDKLLGFTTKRAEQHKIPNDKVTVSFFNQTAKQWEKGLLGIWENPKDRKHGKIVSKMTHSNKLDATSPYDAFDKAVFCACFSIQAAGNHATTLDIIYSHMTGSKRREPTEKMRNEIWQSIKKMAACWIRVDTSEIDSAYGYKASRSIYEGQLLYAEFLSEAEINRKPAQNVVHFLRISPLVEIAEIRNQILSFPVNQLGVLTASKELIMATHELLRRIHSMKNHDEMGRVIRFDTIFQGTGYEEMTPREKTRLRARIIAELDKRQGERLFESYTIEKEGKTPAKIRLFFGEDKTEGNSSTTKVQK